MRRRLRRRRMSGERRSWAREPRRAKAVFEFDGKPTAPAPSQAGAARSTTTPPCLRRCRVKRNSAGSPLGKTPKSPASRPMRSREAACPRRSDPWNLGSRPRVPCLATRTSPKAGLVRSRSRAGGRRRSRRPSRPPRGRARGEAESWRCCSSSSGTPPFGVRSGRPGAPRPRACRGRPLHGRRRGAWPGRLGRSTRRLGG
jgi:hypothetical protein